MNDPLVGQEIDGYEITTVLGRGGMGMVYKAEDVALRRPVAIKRINPGQAHSETFLRRFRSEARALARIDSEYIVRIYALRETDIGLLIVMEFVGGGTIDDLIDEHVGRPAAEVWPEALPYVKQSLMALEAAHQAGVIHRDIKPQNIMLTDDRRMVKVTDFGLAKLTRKENETVTNSVGGTLKYMSPEQIERPSDIDYRSDLHSMGMTAYEMFAGRLPFDDGAGDFSIMRTIVEAEIPTIDTFAPGLPQPLIDIITKATAREPEDRYQSAREMVDAIEAFEVAHRSTSGGDGESAVSSPPLAGSYFPSGNTDETILDDVDLDETILETDDAPRTGAAPGMMDVDERDMDRRDMDGRDFGDDGADAPVAEPTPQRPQRPQKQEHGNSLSGQDAWARADSKPWIEEPTILREGGDFSEAVPPTAMRSGRPAPQADDDDDGGGGMGLYLGIAALVLALAGGAFVFWPDGSGATADTDPDPSAETAATVPLSLDTQPGDAAVTVNGEGAGVAPLRSYQVEAGEVRVRLERDGYAPLDTVLTARVGETLDYDLQMRPLETASTGGETGTADEPDPAPSTPTSTAPTSTAPSTPTSTAPASTSPPSPQPSSSSSAARLTVITEPSGAQVYIGDQLLGTTPLRGQAVSQTGDVQIRVERDGYGSQVLQRRMVAGETASVRGLELTRSDELTATLDLASPSSGVRVSLNGQDQGETGTLGLLPGTYDVQFTHPRYGTADTTVTVGPDQSRALTCYFEQEVVVNMGGGLWGNVILNGANTQESTPHRLTLGPGTHRVGVNIARKDVVIQGGLHRTRTGDRDQQDTFVGDTRTITIRPSFQPRSHALVFNASQ